MRAGHRFLGTLAILVVSLLAATAEHAVAQDRPAPAIEFAGGVLLFPDDGTVTEGMVGGAGRFYLSPRISIGPEIAFIQGDSHSHLMLTGNVTFDLVAPVNGEPAAVTPFAVIGAGLFRSRESFLPDNFTSSEGAFTAGGGIRVRVGRSVFVGAEARIGWELHIRVNGLVGVRLGR